MKTSGFRALVLVGLGLVWVAGFSAAAGEAALEWRVGPTAWSFRSFSFFEAVNKTASLGMKCLEAYEGQRVRPDSDAKLDAALPDEAIGELRAKLQEAGVALTSIYIHRIPGDEEACRRTFEFARKLGVEFIVSEPEPEALDLIEECCEEYAISVAIHNHPKGGSRYWHPEEVLKVCEGRGPRIGACADTGHWLRSGLDPVEGMRLLGKRVISLHFKDLDEATADGRDVPWGKGCGEMEDVLRTLHELRLTPALFGIEYESNPDDNLAEIRECGEWFREATARLSR